MFQKMYKDEPDNWQEVDEKEVRYRLEEYYRSVDNAIYCMQAGMTQDTPFAIFRWIESHE